MKTETPSIKPLADNGHASTFEEANSTVSALLKRGELPHAEDTPWDDEQKALVAEYMTRIECVFDDMPNNGKLYFSHAAEVLRHVARKFD